MSPLTLPRFTCRGEEKIVSSFCFTAAASFSVLAAASRFSSSAIASCSNSGWLSRYSRTIFSISPRCSAETACARTGDDAGNATAAAMNTAAIGASENRIVVILSQSTPDIRRLVAGDVVRLGPSRRSDRETGLGASGNLARSAQVAAVERRLRRGEIGMGEVALAGIGDRKLGVGVGRLRRAAQRAFEHRHR